MLFNSMDFLIFFPIVLLIYLLLPSKIRYVWLLVSSYYFYMCWNPLFVVLIILTTVITYLCGILINCMRKKMIITKVVLIGSFVLNIGLLIYFKYTNFLIDSINKLLVQINLDVLPTFDILLPVGISFYTFQALGYTIDVYRGKVEPEKNILKYALFIAFFPQLVAGPIERSENLLNQIREEKNRKLWNYNRITSGLITMLWGFFLKIVIADRVAVLVNHVFECYEQYKMVGLIIGALGFALQIYCDFSGYSAIAIGAARVLGFDLMENFNTPYFARGIADFWKRWHISLSTWFRDYLYIPLGGNRCSKWKQYRNILITFGVSGLWHGANFTYVAWGLIHGFYQIVEKELNPLFNKLNQKIHTKTNSFGYRLGQMALTFVLVDLAWIFFRANSIGQALHYIQRMFLYRDWWALFDGTLYTLGLNMQEVHILMFSIVMLICVGIVKFIKNKTLADFLEGQWIVFRWGVILTLLFTCMVFGYYGPNFDSSKFIYFQF